MALIGLMVIKRFSALVLVLFVLTRSLISLFVCAVLFDDIITSLEYKGCMITVLGLVLWGLEVAKSMLEPNSALGIQARLAATQDEEDSFAENSFEPSNFLEGDAAEKAHEERQREREAYLRMQQEHEEDALQITETLIVEDQQPPMDEMTRARLSRSGFYSHQQNTILYANECDANECDANDEEEIHNHLDHISPAQ